MVLEPGETCWRVAQADRFRVIVDAADFFRIAKQAMLLAEHSIMLIGWDFDTRIEFEPEHQTLEGPVTLGAFLDWLPRQRPDLDVYLLKWDLGGLQMIGRKQMPFFVKNYLTDPRLHFHLDGVHPQGAAHHSKIIVIDDSLAFCGGIDMTTSRWDTREHLDEDPRRTDPNGASYKAWHDATTLVSGPAAQALGGIARHRWRRATREVPKDYLQPRDLWPEGLEPDFENIPVGIARSAPAFDEDEQIREIEALYLAAIESTQRTLYIESQYLASRTLAEALVRRLREADGPEIVLVLPENAEGWLQRLPMDGARRKLLNMLWHADRHGRFRAYYPVTEAGNLIYVHAKVLVADDTLLRVGSSNLNNRSMGFDTECDLIVEAEMLPEHRRGGFRARVLDIRDDLVAEHLDVDVEKLRAELDRQDGHLIPTIDALIGSGRTLRRFSPGKVLDEDSVLAENELADPENADPEFLHRLAASLHSVWTRMNDQEA